MYDKIKVCVCMCVFVCRLNDSRFEQEKQILSNPFYTGNAGEKRHYTLNMKPILI